MKAMTLAVGLLCAMPLVGLGDPSTAHRAAAKPDAPPSTTTRALEPDGPRPGARRPAEKLADKVREFKPTEQQVADAEAFIETHAPNRFRAYKKTRDAGPGAHLNLKRWIARNHLELKALENADPELYAMKLDELRIEDDIFGVVSAPREKGPADRERVRQEIRPMLQELLAKRKEESAHRIARMRTALQSEQKQLDEMSTDSDQWITARLNEELSRGGRLVLPAPGRRDVNGPTTAEN